VTLIKRRVVLAAIALAGLALLVIGGVIAAGDDWLPFSVEAEAVCADGSEPSFMERPAAADKVVLYFEGGGACFSAASCAFEGDEATYFSSSLASAEWLADRGGIFDLANPENPLADHSFVYVPYCTGDAHLGTATHRYSDELTVEHKGFINASAALDHLVRSYPDIRELLVTGVSARSIPTPLFAGLAADRLPDAQIVTLGDSSGAYPDIPALNGYIGSLWGVEGSIPSWPEMQGSSLDGWSVPGLYVAAGRHAPDVTFARFDHANDEAQAFYTKLVGGPADDSVNLIDSIEADIEASGTDVASFVAPGATHTILGDDGLYELEVGGVRFVDWFSELVAGDTPPDVHCIECD
jgi:hypothetical protein